MNTILHTPATGASTYHPGGLRDGAALAEIGEIFPGTWNLGEVYLPQPPHNPATHHAIQLCGVPDLEAGEWRVGWQIAPNQLPPEAITPRQMRLALLARGISPAMIEAALAGDEAAMIEWEYSLEIRRDHPLVASMAAAMGMDDADVIDLFSGAAEI